MLHKFASMHFYIHYLWMMCVYVCRLLFVLISFRNDKSDIKIALRMQFSSERAFETLPSFLCLCIIVVIWKQIIFEFCESQPR